MAALNNEPLQKGKPKGKLIIRSTKVDLTPMVDLGFLLISFFIFTTEISKPAITNLYMPKDGDSTKIPESKSLTILSGNNDYVYYYNGDMNQAIKNNQVFRTSYDEINGIGNVIRQKQNELKKRKIDWIDMEKAGYDSADEMPVDEVEIGLQVETVKKAMMQLPDGYRTVLSLYLLEGYDHEEIAEILQVAESTTRTQYMRAKQKLLQHLKQGVS